MNAYQAFASILDNNGGTFDITFGLTFYDTELHAVEFAGGYMVSDAGAEVVYSVDAFNPLCILDYANDHADGFRYGFLGAWVHEGFVYLDVSRHYATEYDARTAGTNNSQLAIFDIAAGEAITL